MAADEIPGALNGRAFAKGHGTENDFVLLTDPDDLEPLSPEQVARLCDRHAGLGADGVLRAVRARHVPEWSGDPNLWFMDYRNADGSIAEMCGNGVRVFLRYLLEEGLAVPDAGGCVPIATRAGLRPATLLPDGRIRVAMGPATVGGCDVIVTPEAGEPCPAYRVEVGNPHAVSFVSELAAVSLQNAPTVAPTEAFPTGVNLEFVRRLGPRRLQMRVYERGSGETRSCGTGTVAVAAAAAVAAGETERPLTYRVEVPGGAVEVELTAEQAYLTGPAIVVARGTTTLL